MGTFDFKEVQDKVNDLMSKCTSKADYVLLELLTSEVEYVRALHYLSDCNDIILEDKL